MTKLPDKLPPYYSPRISSELPDCSSPLTFDTYSRCSMRCQYCVPKGSGITMVDGSIKQVEDVQVGDVVLGYNEDDNSPEATVVEKTMCREDTRTITFRTESTKFKVTPEHPIFTKDGGWVDAKDVAKGDLILTHNIFVEDPVTSKIIELIFSRKPIKAAHKHRLYAVWNVMIQRCHYPTNDKFMYYGLRGIQVCSEWRHNPFAFYTWAEAHGYVEGLELDREDNDGDYTPDNCRFVTHQINSSNRNKRKTNVSGYIGVSNLPNGRFRARSIGRDSLHNSAERAAIMRDRTEKETDCTPNFARIPHAILRWECIEYTRTHYVDVEVYNFECWPNNNYFAQIRDTTTSAFTNGVLIHNCFSHAQKDVNPGTKDAPLQGVDAEKLFQMIDGTAKTKEAKLFYKYFFKDKFLFHWGGLADSFCHYERKYDMSYPILKGLLERKYPLMFSSKGPAITDDKYVTLFEKYKKQNTTAFQFSIVTADDDLAKKVEPGVPSPTERFENMKVLSDMGYWTILRLRPFIIGVTDESLPELLQKAYESGAKAISTEFFAMDQRCVGSMRKATENMGRLMGIDNIFSYFNKLSPKERGGYNRLNRLVKEPFVKYMYKFCLEHDMVFTCSDPDFKELCQSENCCGLPPHGEHPTPSMNNWSTHQMTSYVMHARIKYHQTGERMLFKFNEVYGKPDWIFDDIALSHMDIGCTKYPYAMRKQLTLRHLLQEKWNNLKSYANPRSYFHGKVMPCGVSEDDNLIYRYNPSDYESRWVSEGIPLHLEWEGGTYVDTKK